MSCRSMPPDVLSCARFRGRSSLMLERQIPDDQAKHLPVQQLPCHHAPLHLVGALVDLGDLWGSCFSPGQHVVHL